MKSICSILLVCLLIPTLGIAQLPCSTYPRERIASCYHSTIMLTPQDSVQYWGQFANPHTTDTSATGRRILSPHTLSPAHYSGTPLAVAAGGNDQLFLLTSQALYGWGMAYNILSPVSGSLYANIQSIPLPDSTLSGTVQLAASDIATIDASSGGIALVTKIDNPGRTKGEVYVKNNMAGYWGRWLYGDGTEGVCDSQWHRVTIDISGAPALDHVARVCMTNMAATALTSEGQVYVWGTGVFLGDGIGEAYQNRAALVMLPQEDGADIVPADINIICSGITHAQFILGQNGKLYSVGTNAWGILGIGVTDFTGFYEWNTVMGPDGSTLGNIMQVSSASSFSIPAIGALDSAGLLYLWGLNEFGMLEGFYSYYHIPNLATSLIAGTDTSRIAHFEMGGHTTIAFHDSTYQMCYLGHRVAGSMGDGGGTEGTVTFFNCEETPEAPICTPLQTIDTTGSDTTGTTTLMLPSGYANSLLLYPNPVEEQLTISGLKGHELIRITDVTGRLLLSTVNGKHSSINIPFHSFNEGMYFINIIDHAGAQATFKVKKRQKK